VYGWRVGNGFRVWGYIAGCKPMACYLTKEGISGVLGRLVGAIIQSADQNAQWR